MTLRLHAQSYDDPIWLAPLASISHGDWLHFTSNIIVIASVAPAVALSTPVWTWSIAVLIGLLGPWWVHRVNALTNYRLAPVDRTVLGLSGVAYTLIGLLASIHIIAAMSVAAFVILAEVLAIHMSVHRDIVIIAHLLSFLCGFILGSIILL